MQSLCSHWRRERLRSRIAGLVYPSHRRARPSSTFESGETSRENRPPPPPPPPPLSFLDVPYYEGDGVCDDKHRLDIYIPSAPFPRPRSRTCLFVHGGSWQRGDRRHPTVPDQFYGNIGRAFARAGMVGLVMSYRLAPGVRHPEQVRDVARAIRWARENAGRYGGDQEDLVLVGHSAGAHLAALCLSDPRWLEEAGVIFPSSTSTRSASTNAAAADHPGASFGAATPTESSLPMPEQQQAHQGRQDRPRQSATKTTVSTPPPLARQPSPMVHVVSGFVGISGVYDIPRMAGNVIGRALANAAFGSDRRLWRRASPVHCVRAAAARAAAAATASARLGRSSTVRAKTTATMEATATAVAHTRSVVAEETSRGNVANRQAAHPGDASPARTGTSKRIFDGVAASVPVAAGEEAAITTPTTAVQDVYTSASHIGTATDAESVFSNKNLVARKPNRISSDAVATGVCPLLSTRVLLLTASSDFHLKEDAEALSAALDDARKRGPGLTPAPSPAIPARNCRNSQRRAIDIALSESVKDGLAEPNARSRPRTIEDDGERADRGFECSEGGRGDGDGDGDGSVGVNDVIDCRNGGGSGDRGDDGSVRHVYLEGEDHMSTMITFGEPGKEASDTVLDFILGLPAPRRPSPRE